MKRSRGVPAERVRALRDQAPRPRARWVLYWMTAYRRHRDNFALDRALEWCAELELPLAVLEPLRCGHRWASARTHAFVIDGMAERAEELAETPALYHPYVEPRAGDGRGLLAAYASQAAVVVADDWPGFFLPRALAAAARTLDCRLEAVDSNGLMPLALPPRAFARAVDLRRFLQRELRPWLERPPRPEPLARAALPAPPRLPLEIARRWPAPRRSWLAERDRDLGALPIDLGVAPVAERGGERAALARLRRFVEHDLPRYGAARQDPCDPATSGLSPWLHFGMLSTHRILAEVARRERWSPDHFGASRRGSKAGTWGMSDAAESFLDQLVTWRELGHLSAQRDPNVYDRWEALPEWARATLEKHARDRRDPLYPLARLEAAATHDEVWNAAQRQLVAEGRIHSYLRMLWGKKILEWSATPRAALDAMLYLNDKYALDGRDPNSVSGITWILGRFDRPWGPERPIYGRVRAMSSDNTRRKLPLRAYLTRFGG